MKISLNWLKSFIKIDKLPEEIETILTDMGLEVDEVIVHMNEEEEVDDEEEEVDDEEEVVEEVDGGEVDEN